MKKHLIVLSILIAVTMLILIIIPLSGSSLVVGMISMILLIVSMCVTLSLFVDNLKGS